MQASVTYNLGFAAAVCVVCAVFVSSAAVALQDLQEANEALERRRNVLIAAGLIGDDDQLAPEVIDARFETIQPVVIDLATGEPVPDVNPSEFDQRAATTDAATSREAPENNAGLQRVPRHAAVYELRDATDTLELIILPISGMGLWSTLYGFVAVDADLQTIRGLTYYEHGETPGLGGEVDNPRWKARWPGRLVYDDEQQVRIEVVRGQAGPPADDPYRVDGLAGATMTSRGVTNMLRFWLGEHGFRPYLERLRTTGGA